VHGGAVYLLSRDTGKRRIIPRVTIIPPRAAFYVMKNIPQRTLAMGAKRRQHCVGVQSCGLREIAFLDIGCYAAGF
jgi:hypothetical protein